MAPGPRPPGPLTHVTAPRRVPPSRGLIGSLLACLAAAALLLTLFWVHFYYACLPARLVWNGLAFVRHEVTGPATDRNWVFTDARVRPMQSKLILTVTRARYDAALLERKIALRLRRVGIMTGLTREAGTSFVVFQDPGRLPVVSYYALVERNGYTWYAEFSQQLERMPTPDDVGVLSDRRAEIFAQFAALLAAVMARG